MTAKVWHPPKIFITKMRLMNSAFRQVTSVSWRNEGKIFIVSCDELVRKTTWRIFHLKEFVKAIILWSINWILSSFMQRKLRKSSLVIFCLLIYYWFTAMSRSYSLSADKAMMSVQFDYSSAKEAMAKIWVCVYLDVAYFNFYVNA